MNFEKNEDNVKMFDDFGKFMGEITFPEKVSGVFDANHTFVDPSLRGLGYGDLLIKKMIEIAREKNKKILPTCPFVSKWFDLHRDFSDICLKY